MTRSSTRLVADDVDQDEQTADSHRDNLECDTSNDHLVATINELLVLGSSCGSHATSDTLEHHRPEIAANEDPRIKAGLDNRVLRSAVQDKVLQGKIDGGGNKTWSKDKRTNLELEPAFAPWVAVHHHTADVAHALKERADSKRGSVSPGLRHDTDDEGGDEHQSKERSQEGIGSHVGTVAIERGPNRASV